MFADAYAVVIASTRSEFVRIPKTSTAAKATVNTSIKTSLTMRCGMKKRITIGRTGKTLDITVKIPNRQFRQFFGLKLN